MTKKDDDLAIAKKKSLQDYVDRRKAASNGRTLFGRRLKTALWNGTDENGKRVLRKSGAGGSAFENTTSHPFLANIHPTSSSALVR